MSLHEIDPDGLPYAPSKMPRKRDISINDFYAVDLRIGHVVEVALLLESRQPAYRLTVDFGPAVGTLQTVAQLTHYPADTLVGRTIVGVINVGLRRVSGVESHFVALGVFGADGTVHLLEPDGNPPSGALIG